MTPPKRKLTERKAFERWADSELLEFVTASQFRKGRTYDLHKLKYAYAAWLARARRGK